ncbi:E3 ubiquitin-protein ligase TRIM39 [Collichthys lucidus]|uniref:E3 ubiquitin-protein ligase TRIM39 n=1 Tax=Collichthys lucidus TaxID=240159 RepID=A0A4U5VQX0_COLLU|nr:E3 ubiquitin-protein ligase TRIM39 [Collichthys lucidus]
MELKELNLFRKLTFKGSGHYGHTKLSNTNRRPLLQLLLKPATKDWTNTGVHSDLSFKTVRDAVTQLKHRVDEVMEELPEIKIKRMREHAVDLTFDPDTAYCSLVISQDRKQVIDGDTEQSLPKYRKRFEVCPEVLTKEGFTTGKFYYEVQVEGSTKWVVGVVRESVNRKMDAPQSVKSGYWTIGLDEGMYSAYKSANHSDDLTLKAKLEKAVRDAVTQLKHRVDEVMEELPEIKMKRMREHAVDLTFDPDTAFCSLVISQDGKQVIDGGTKQSLPNNPRRFAWFPEVLTKEGFTTGKFYYEVQVEGSTRWITGVVRESVDRKEGIFRFAENGYWTIGLKEGIYSACRSILQRHKITLKAKLEKAVRDAVTQLKHRVDEVMEELPEIKMKRMREHAVDLTFDPDTAFCSLVISQDGKQVIDGGTKQSLPNNPRRFAWFPEVLTKEGFTTGKFYYEVQVEGSTRWITGVVRESVDRKEGIFRFAENGYWTIGLKEGIYSACRSILQRHKITLKAKLEKTVRDAVTQLKHRVDEVMEELPEIKMKRMREHAVDLTFDPDTANCSLVISQAGKQVIAGGTKQSLPNNPRRFEVFPEVLTKEGFTTGKFYYEVQVEGSTRWITGVVRESVDRKEGIFRLAENGYWTIGLKEGIYSACRSILQRHKITLKEKLEKVGIFVDYNKGVVSFYDVISKSHIYSFTGCHFTEKLYPFFHLQPNRNQTNPAHLIITPVTQAH